MKVLMISSDRKSFEKRSAVRSRLLEYGRLADELEVIVFSKKSLCLRDEKIQPNISLYPTNSPSKFLHIPYALLRALRLKRLGVNIDVVTTQDPFELGLAGYLIARILNARLHIQVHTDFMSPYFARESIFNQVRVLLAKILIPRAHAIRVVSERIKNSLSPFSLQLSTVAVLPILIETKDVPTTIDIKKKYPQFNFHILVASRLSREKNIESVIDAMKDVVKVDPKAGLIIVGSGPLFEVLKQKIENDNLQTNIIFEDWQDNLSDYYKTADIFVLCSYYEGYGMTAVEALSNGLPVIMTDVGCAGDIVKDGQNGLILPVGDTKALAGALSAVISGKLKFDVKPPKLMTKEEYLAAYRKSWEDALV